MDRPDWVPAPTWGRLNVALQAQPQHAADALLDLRAALSDWSEDARARLLERFVEHAESGVELPGAFIAALSDLLEGDDV